MNGQVVVGLITFNEYWSLYIYISKSQQIAIEYVSNLLSVSNNVQLAFHWLPDKAEAGIIVISL